MSLRGILHLLSLSYATVRGSNSLNSIIKEFSIIQRMMMEVQVLKTVLKTYLNGCMPTQSPMSPHLTVTMG